MDDAAKKTALRMIPYGIYVLTAEASDGSLAAATVNWVTQTSFDPALVAVGVKADSSRDERSGRENLLRRLTAPPCRAAKSRPAPPIPSRAAL